MWYVNREENEKRWKEKGENFEPPQLPLTEANPKGDCCSGSGAAATRKWKCSHYCLCDKKIRTIECRIGEWRSDWMSEWEAKEPVNVDVCFDEWKSGRGRERKEMYELPLISVLILSSSSVLLLCLSQQVYQITSTNSSCHLCRRRRLFHWKIFLLHSSYSYPTSGSSINNIRLFQQYTPEEVVNIHTHTHSENSTT